MEEIRGHKPADLSGWIYQTLLRYFAMDSPPVIPLTMPGSSPPRMLTLFIIGAEASGAYKACLEIDLYLSVLDIGHDTGDPAAGIL